MAMTVTNGRASRPPGADGELAAALELIEREVRAGLAHGFSELTVACEVVAGKKRQLTIRSGRSFRFVLPQHPPGA